MATLFADRSERSLASQLQASSMQQQQALMQQQGLGLIGGQASMGSLHTGAEARAISMGLPPSPKPKPTPKRYSSIREELQAETDDWLKDTI